MKKLAILMLYMLCATMTWSQTDYTSKVSNTHTAWGGTNMYTAGSMSMVEYYQENHFYRNAMCQTVTGLPVGVYKAEVYCNASCAAWSCSPIANDGDTGYTHLYLNDAEVDVPVYNVKSVSSPTLYTLTDIHVTDGTLRLGTHNDREGANWHIIRCKSLKYMGVDSKSLYEALFPLVRKGHDACESLAMSDYRTRLEECISAAMQAQETDGVEKLQLLYDNLSNSIAECKSFQDSYSTALKSLLVKMNNFQSTWNNGTVSSADSWATLLNAVSEAAIAKDQTNDTQPLTKAAAHLDEVMNVIATGIGTVQAAETTPSFYHLNGTKAHSNDKGIIVREGKKIIR